MIASGAVGLRVRVGATLDAMHAKTEPRDWRLPARDVAELPAVGYVGGLSRENANDPGAGR